MQEPQMSEKTSLVQVEASHVFVPISEPCSLQLLASAKVRANSLPGIYRSLSVPYPSHNSALPRIIQLNVEA